MHKLWQHLCEQAQRKPNDVAILSFDDKLHCAYTWKTLRDETEQLARTFKSEGVQVLALLAANSPAWIVVDLACRLQGVVLLPVPSFFSDSQWQHVFTSLGIDSVLTDCPQRLASAVNGPFIEQGEYVGLSYLKAPESSLSSFDNHNLLPASTQKITFTSGSTGSPKGVCLGQELIDQVTDSLVAATTECHVERHLCVLPLATLLENIAGVYVPLMAGAQVVVASEEALGFNGASGFALPVFLDVLSRCRPNSMILIPQLLEALVSSCEAGWQLPDSLRFIAVGGAKVSPTLLEKAWQFGLPVFEGYGLSECASVVTLNTPQARRNGSLGKVLPHTSVALIDGEIVVTGPRFLGYLADKASWQNAHNEQGLETGDLAQLDEDGFLFFHGRKKNVLVSSFGRNINPEWVEAELNAQDMIAQSFVFGDGQAYCVALLAVYNNGMSDEAIEALVQQANQTLPSYARAKKWHRLSAPLPRGTGEDADLLTSNGRPKRAQIEEAFKRELALLYTNDDVI